MYTEDTWNEVNCETVRKIIKIIEKLGNYRTEVYAEDDHGN